MDPGSGAECNVLVHWSPQTWVCTQDWPLSSQGMWDITPGVNPSEFLPKFKARVWVRCRGALPQQPPKIGNRVGVGRSLGLGSDLNSHPLGIGDFVAIRGAGSGVRLPGFNSQVYCTGPQPRGFCAPSRLGDVWPCLETLLVDTAWGSCYCHLGGGGQGCCPTSSNARAAPHPLRENDRPPKSMEQQREYGRQRCNYVGCGVGATLVGEVTAYIM